MQSPEGGKGSDLGRGQAVYNREIKQWSDL